MFTGLKKQLEISDILIENILPLDNELVKLRKILNWEKINEVYSSCYRSQLGNKTKTTDKRRKSQDERSCFFHNRQLRIRS